MQHDRDYPIKLGASTLSTFRYEFLPASVDVTAPSVVTLNGKQATVERPLADGGTARFVGEAADAGATDFALVFKGDHFVLEKIGTVATNLRHVRDETPTPRPKRAKKLPKKQHKAAPATIGTVMNVSRR